MSIRLPESHGIGVDSIRLPESIVSEINDTKEIPEGTFPINLKLIQEYQGSEPSITDKYKDGTYNNGSFHGLSYILILNL